MCVSVAKDLTKSSISKNCLGGGILRHGGKSSLRQQEHGAAGSYLFRQGRNGL